MDDWGLLTTTRSTRRSLLFITGAVAAGAGATGGSGSAAAQPGAVAPRIEPVTVKRRGTGLRGHDQDRAFAGWPRPIPRPFLRATSRAASAANSGSPNILVFLLYQKGRDFRIFQAPATADR